MTDPPLSAATLMCLPPPETALAPLPRFIARVEFLGAPDDADSKLETALLAVGFTRAIQGADGRVFKLPSGTYVGDVRSADVVKVKDAIARIARAIYPSAWVLVTRGPSAWATEELEQAPVPAGMTRQ